MCRRRGRLRRRRSWLRRSPSSRTPIGRRRSRRCTCTRRSSARSSWQRRRPRNHWWNVALYVDVRGLTTRRLTHGDVSFDLTFDFVDHRLVLRTDRGVTSGFALEDGLTVAAFDASLHRLLRDHGLDVEIVESPFGISVTTPFPEDEEDASYEREYIERYWRVLRWADAVLDEFSGWFCGKQSPVHLFWHGLDLAYTRFSGRRAPEPAGLDPVNREAYSHEVISFGFWAGDESVPEPSFYSYTAPGAAGPAGAAVASRDGTLAGTANRLPGPPLLRRGPACTRAATATARVPAERVRGRRLVGRLGCGRSRLLGLSVPERSAAAASPLAASPSDRDPARLGRSGRRRVAGDAQAHPPLRHVLRAEPAVRVRRRPSGRPRSSGPRSRPSPPARAGRRASGALPRRGCRARS